MYLLFLMQGLIKEEYENHWRPSDEEVESRILPSANKVRNPHLGTAVNCRSSLPAARFLQ
jgi:hypothetical protein